MPCAKQTELFHRLQADSCCRTPENPVSLNIELNVPGFNQFHSSSIVNHPRKQILKTGWWVKWVNLLMVEMNVSRQSYLFTLAELLCCSISTIKSFLPLEYMKELVPVFTGEREVSRMWHQVGLIAAFSVAETLRMPYFWPVHVFLVVPCCTLVKHSMAVYTGATYYIMSQGMFDLDYCTEYYLQNNHKGIVKQLKGCLLLGVANHALIPAETAAICKITHNCTGVGLPVPTVSRM